MSIEVIGAGEGRIAQRERERERERDGVKGQGMVPIMSM